MKGGEVKIKLVRRMCYDEGYRWRQRGYIMLLAATQILRGVIELGSFGWLTSELPQAVIFSEKLEDWIEGR